MSGGAGPDDACIRGQWRAFSEFQSAGGARSLAVSNFTPKELDVVIAPINKPSLCESPRLWDLSNLVGDVATQIRA